MFKHNRIVRILGKTYPDCTRRRKAPEECFKGKDEMDILFNVFKHIDEIYAYGIEIMKELVIST